MESRIRDNNRLGLSSKLSHALTPGEMDIVVVEIEEIGIEELSGRVYSVGAVASQFVSKGDVIEFDGDIEDMECRNGEYHMIIQANQVFF